MNLDLTKSQEAFAEAALGETTYWAIKEELEIE